MAANGNVQWRSPRLFASGVSALALVLACGSNDAAVPGATGAGQAGVPAAAGAPSAPSAGSGNTTATGGSSGGSAGSGAAGDSSRSGATASGAGGTSSSSAGATAGGNGGNGGAGAAGGRVGRGGQSGQGGGTSAPGGMGGKAAPVPVKDLPIIKEMPDPLTMNDGTKVTTMEQWRARRQEMIQLLEDYEYGHMPPPPGNVTATVVTEAHDVTVGSQTASYRMLHLTFGPNASLGFDLGLYTPVGGDAAAKSPVFVSLTSSATEKSIGSASAAFARGYAVATVPYGQLGADSSDWHSTAFFPAYPDYDFRDISAWAWGLSRAIDYLVTDPAVDADKIIINGVSRLAQAVLLAGAFDERVALSAPVAGGAALRFSGKEMGMGLGQGINEIVDQNTYWFGPRFPDFKNQTPRLPSDQHWLPALTAPRLFIMCNSLADQYGRAYAAVQTYLSAQPVFDFSGVSDNLGENFRAGSHGMTSEDWSAVLDFADQYLMKKPGTRTFNVLPPASDTP